MNWKLGMLVVGFAQYVKSLDTSGNKNRQLYGCIGYIVPVGNCFEGREERDTASPWADFYNKLFQFHALSEPANKTGKSTIPG